MNIPNFSSKASKLLCGAVLFLLFTTSRVNAQGFIAASTFLGANGSEQQAQMYVENGFTYIVGQTFLGSGINLFPKTVGGAASGQWDMTVTKLDSSGNIVWSRFLGGSNIEFCSRIMVSNGSLFIVGNTTSTDYPVTDGSTFSGVVNNGFFTRLNASTGDIQFSTLYGQGSAYDLDVTDGYLYVVGYKYINALKANDILIVKYDVATSALVYNKTYGGSGTDAYQNQFYGRNFKVVNNDLFIVFNTFSTNFPVTDGSSRKGPGDMVYAKINAATGNIIFATYFGGTSSGIDFLVDLRVDNNGVYIFGITEDNDFPVTDGSVYGGAPDDAFLIKFNATTNQVMYSKYIGGDQFDEGMTMEVQNNVVYLLTNSNSFSNFPITTGYAYAQGGGDLAVTKLDGSTGKVTWSTFITASISAEQGVQMKVVNGEIYLTAITYSNNYPVTNGSVRTGGGGSDETVLTKIGANNNICYSTFLGSSGTDYPVGIFVEGDYAYISGLTASASFPVTNSTSRSGGYDYYWTKFNLNPTITPGPDNVSPATQTVCKNGLAAPLTAPAITFPSSNMPLIYRSGVPNTQNPIDLRYQWQTGNPLSGVWTNIPGAVELTYSPQVGLTDQYYRRNTYASLCSNTIPVSTSSVAAVLVNANTAPTVNAGGVINTCAGVPVTLGGAPAATANGGASIVSYAWTPSAAVFTPSAAVANPSVTPASTTIYTLRVTDNNGCAQIAQALVNAYSANAGPDVSSCNSQVVRIGTTPIAGLPGVTYSWSSVAGDPVSTLSCTSCAQADVSGLTQVSTFRLTLTVPVTSGGTCTSTDDVVVSPVGGPVSSFGAPDVTICSGGSSSIGNAVEPGFTYTWSPGNYLSANTTTPTTFQPGNFDQFNPNPFIYYLTAAKNGCIFVDSVYAYVLKADAGLDGCGPKMVGIPNPTPSINATYSWTKITAGAGTSNFTGATNLPQVPVSACTVATVFELTVSYNGTKCTDQVTISPCGCVNPDIKIKAPNGCASYSINAGDVVLTASAAAPSIFTWSTTGGVTLSAYSGVTVSLTNNASGDVTVTATSTLDPSSACTYTIPVNGPAWSLPTFKAFDTTICPLTPVNIGQAPVAGYTYAWDGLASSLSPNSTVSNPVATVNSTASFMVLVTDIGSGCIFRDTATLTVIGFPPNIAGNAVSFCGVSTSVQLGLPAIPGMTYIWTPATTYAPNNTAANPTVTVATTTKFFVTATNTVTGCSKTDSVLIAVKPPVAPFSFSDQSYCPAVVGSIPLPAGPAAMAAYSWSPATLVISPASNGPVATTLAARPQTATTYTLTVTNASGCTGSGTVNFIPSTTVPDAGSNRVICKNSTTQIGGAAEAGATYAWSGPAAANLSSTAISNPVFTPTANGSFLFTVTKTNASGCVTTAQVTVVVVDFILSAITSPTVCENTCIQIGTFTQPGVQYFWSPSTGLSNSGISNPMACVTTTSMAYTLTAIGVNGCVASQTVIVGVNPTPSPTVSIPTLNTCLGSSTSSFQPTVSPAGSYNFLWSPANGTLSSIYDQYPSVTPVRLGTSTYTLNVSNTLTGCASNARATLNTFYCNVLSIPVRLRATLLQSDVTIQWNIQTQASLQYYEVERSTDGVHYFVIEKIPVARVKLYTIYDHAPEEGYNFYRLKFTDIEGRYGYSGIEKVHLAKITSLTVYPNPAGQYINLGVTGNMVNKPAQLMLIAADGRIVLQKRISLLNRTERVEISNVLSGKYYLRIASASSVTIKEITVIK